MAVPGASAVNVAVVPFGAVDARVPVAVLPVARLHDGVVKVSAVPCVLRVRCDFSPLPRFCLSAVRRKSS